MPRAARARRGARRARSGTPTPRRCRGTGRSSPRAASWRTRSARRPRAAADAAASPSSRRSSLHATSRSPSRIADERPKAAASPTQPGRAVRALERAMRRGAAAAGVGVVDDVVVHERGGVEDLERGRRGHDGIGRRRRRRRDASATARQPAMQNRPRRRFPPVERGRRGLDEQAPLRRRDRRSTPADP